MDDDPGPARWRALGGVAGPVAFVTAWSVLGAGKAGYSPWRDPISELAAVGASTRVPMTIGFFAFGAGVGAYAGALRKGLPGGAGTTAAITAAATIGAGALPLGASFGGGPHGVAAAIGYASLAATPWLGAAPLAQQGRRRAASWSRVAAVATGAALVASRLAPDRTGLFQRAGLLVGDAWIVATAVWLARRRP